MRVSSVRVEPQVPSDLTGSLLGKTENGWCRKIGRDHRLALRRPRGAVCFFYPSHMSFPTRHSRGPITLRSLLPAQRFGHLCHLRCDFKIGCLFHLFPSRYEHHSMCEMRLLLCPRREFRHALGLGQSNPSRVLTRRPAPAG